MRVNIPCTIILCGLSGSGKSTLARGVYNFFVKNTISAELMDADVYRKILSPNDSFDEESRNTFRKKLFFVSKLLNKNGITTIIPMICSNPEIRNIARQELDNLYEIYLNTTIETCIRRNPKGLYTKIDGKFKKNITGIDIPFIVPSKADFIVDCENDTVEASLKKMLSSIKKDIKLDTQ